VARYDWVDSEGTWHADANTDIDCHKLRASWVNEKLPKRIVNCVDTPRPVATTATPAQFRKIRFEPQILIRPSGPGFGAIWPRSRTEGQRNVAEITDGRVRVDDMVFSLEDMPGSASFVHKRILGAVGGFISGGPTGAIGGFLGGGGKGPQKHAAIQRARPAPIPTQASMSFAPQFGGDCVIPGQRVDPLTGKCRFFLGTQSGPDPVSPGPGGVSMNGRPTTSPGSMSINRLVCPPGYVLDRNSQCSWGLPRNSKMRKWRPGRKPLFTGGDLNAIARSARLGDAAEEIFKKTNPAKKAVARSYRSNWRKPLKK